MVGVLAVTAPCFSLADLLESRQQHSPISRCVGAEISSNQGSRSNTKVDQVLVRPMDTGSAWAKTRLRGSLRLSPRPMDPAKVRTLGQQPCKESFKCTTALCPAHRAATPQTRKEGTHPRHPRHRRTARSQICRRARQCARTQQLGQEDHDPPGRQAYCQLTQ